MCFRLVTGKHGLMHIDSEGLYIFVLGTVCWNHFYVGHMTTDFLGIASQNFRMHAKWQFNKQQKDLIFTVHSLSFLREATEFFAPYCKTVIQRLGFVCRSWNGLISRNQLKKSGIKIFCQQLFWMKIFDK